MTYHPPSLLSRVALRFRGTVVSLLVGTLVLVSAAYFWLDQQHQRLEHQQTLARAAAAEGNYPRALQLYDANFKAHQAMFDRSGQIENLIEQSRTLLTMGQIDKALIRIQRAAEMGNNSDVTLMQEQIHRQAGSTKLAQAKASLDSALYSQALSQAEVALQSLQTGQAAPYQLAASHRVIAVASAQLREDSKATQHLAKAKSLQGQSAANRVAEAKVQKLKTAHARERELAWKKTKKTELAVAKAALRQRQERPALSHQPLYPAHQYHYQPLATSSAAGSSQPYLPPSAPRSFIPKPSYPTYQPPSPTFPTSSPPVGQQAFPQTSRPAAPAVVVPSFPAARF